MIRIRFSAALALIVFFLISSVSFAQEERLFSNSLSVGVVRIGDIKTGAMFWRGNAHARNVYIGLDVNMLLSERKPKTLDSVVLRRLEYDTGTEGIIYGPISDLTLGHGMVLNSYSSLDREGVLLGNEGMGTEIYYLGEFFDFEAFGTWTHIYGVRFSEDFYGVQLGQTFVTDADGERIKCLDGTEKRFDGRSVMGIDLEAPLFGDFDFYSEIANIQGGGTGYLAGIQWAYNVVAVAISLRAEGRYLDPGFAPGYLGWGYEMNPIDMASLEASGLGKRGYFAGMRATVLGFFYLNFSYEGYEESNGAFYVDSWFRVYGRLLLSVYMKQPSFADYRWVGLEDGTMMGGSLRYDLSPSAFVAFLLKKGFNPKVGAVEESSLIEFGFIL